MTYWFFGPFAAMVAVAVAAPDPVGTIALAIFVTYLGAVFALALLLFVIRQVFTKDGVRGRAVLYLYVRDSHRWVLCDDEVQVAVLDSVAAVVKTTQITGVRQCRDCPMLWIDCLDESGKPVVVLLGGYFELSSWNAGVFVRMEHTRSLGVPLPADSAG